MNKLIASILILALFIGCKGPKETTNTSSLKKMKEKDLIEKLEENTFTKNTLTAKVSGRFESPDSKASFSASLRMEKDSIIWASISVALGIEVARLKITPDTVLLIDKFNGKYFAGNFSFISKLIHTELSFEMLQNILLEQSLFELKRRYFESSIVNNYYLLTSLEEDEVEDIKSGKDNAEILKQIYQYPEHFHMYKQQMQDFEKNRKVSVTYGNYEKVDDILFPTKISLFIKDPKGETTLDLSFSRIKLNEKLSFPFNVPSKYDPM